MPNFIYFINHKDTDSKYKDSVKECVQNLNNLTRKNKTFFNNLTFHICNSYKDIEKNSPLTKYVNEHYNDFTYTGGMTTPALGNNNKKEIIIKTSSPGIFNITFNKNCSDVTQATVHEIGHQFDDYFGYCDPELLKKVKKLPLNTDIKPTKAQEELYDKYFKNKDLSDSKIFKEAWKKDAENLGKDTWSNFFFKKRHIDYYIWDINITDGVTDKEIEDAEYHRAEIFAQLFSYALGEDDGQKKDIIKKFENCYKIVKRYIKEYLGITINN